LIKESGVYDIRQPISEIANEVNSVLDNRKKERYFEKIVLLYSFIENLLKWLVFVKTIWDKCEKELADAEADRLRSFCKRLNFYEASNVALSIDLIDFNLYREIDAIREERNNIIHQLWIYSHRDNFLALRKRLEKLAKVANRLVEILNQLTEEVGIEEVYQIFL